MGSWDEKEKGGEGVSLKCGKGLEIRAVGRYRERA